MDMTCYCTGGKAIPQGVVSLTPCEILLSEVRGRNVYFFPPSQSSDMALQLASFLFIFLKNLCVCGFLGAGWFFDMGIASLTWI